MFERSNIVPICKIQDQELEFAWPTITTFEVTDDGAAFIFEYVRDGRKAKRVKLLTSFVSSFAFCAQFGGRLNENAMYFCTYFALYTDDDMRADLSTLQYHSHTCTRIRFDTLLKRRHPCANLIHQKCNQNRNRHQSARGIIDAWIKYRSSSYSIRH